MTKTNSLKNALFSAMTLAATAFAATACGGAAGGSAGDRDANADMLQPGTPDIVQFPKTGTGSDGGAGTGNDGGSSSSNEMKIAVKYVALKQSASDAASPTQAEVESLLANMTQVWAACEIKFVLDSYETPVASEKGLAYNPANHSQLEEMRRTFDDRRHALLVKTGSWNRSGDLGNDGSNGFSTLPPENVEGAVFEEWVATSTLLIAHEIGHLIGGLDHTGSSTNLMNHYVSPSTKDLSEAQCNDTRAAMQQYHSGWLR